MCYFFLYEERLKNIFPSLTILKMTVYKLEFLQFFFKKKVIKIIVLYYYIEL